MISNVSNAKPRVILCYSVHYVFEHMLLTKTIIVRNQKANILYQEPVWTSNVLDADIDRCDMFGHVIDKHNSSLQYESEFTLSRTSKNFHCFALYGVTFKC